MNDLIETTKTDLVLNQQAMEQMYKLAELMASSKVTVPAHLRGSAGDCMAIVMQSMRWGMDSFAVAQKTHLVNGVLGYEAQLINAVISGSKAIEGRFKYEFKWEDGKTNGLIRCGAVIAKESEITWGEWLNTALVTTKNSPLWKTAPKQQACYLAVKYWARIYTPDVILGVYTADELQDNVKPKRERNVTPKGKGAFAELTKSKKPPIEPQPEETTSPAFDKWHAQILQCCEMSELNEVTGALSKDKELSTSEINALRAIYSTHKQTL